MRDRNPRPGPLRATRGGTSSWRPCSCATSRRACPGCLAALRLRSDPRQCFQNMLQLTPIGRIVWNSRGFPAVSISGISHMDVQIAEDLHPGYPTPPRACPIYLPRSRCRPPWGRSFLPPLERKVVSLRPSAEERGRYNCIVALIQRNMLLTGFAREKGSRRTWSLVLSALQWSLCTS